MESIKNVATKEFRSKPRGTIGEVGVDFNSEVLSKQLCTRTTTFDGKWILTAAQIPDISALLVYQHEGERES